MSYLVFLLEIGAGNASNSVFPTPFPALFSPLSVFFSLSCVLLTRGNGMADPDCCYFVDLDWLCDVFVLWLIYHV